MNSPSTSTTELPDLAVQLTVPQLTEILIREHGLHQGHYEFSAVFTVTIGTFTLPDLGATPGTLSGLAGVGLRRVDSPTPLSADASKVNPKPSRKPTRATKSTGLK